MKQIGIIGAGTMGGNLALNFADNGTDVVIYDRSDDAADARAAQHERIQSAHSHTDLVKALQIPRAILMMVPSGDPVDEQVETLKPLLDEGDILIDGGNSHFQDTMRRVNALQGSGKTFVGMGVSGGADGARHGPSLMVGGTQSSWKTLKPLLEPIAATTTGGEPCAKWMGCQGAGHFVKSAHNGIEYSDMQMIAEIYGLLRYGLDHDTDAVAGIFADWNETELKSYLVEITAEILATQDSDTDQPIIDVILDTAAQKGTGRWTVIEAQRLAAPLSTIAAAVTARVMSSKRDMRAHGEDTFGNPRQSISDGQLTPDDLYSALMAGKIICYTLGFDLIIAASKQYDMDVHLPDVARVWRAGCIIRWTLLDEMVAAFEEDATRCLAFAPAFKGRLQKHLPGLRRTVAAAALKGHAVPGLSTALAWFDQLTVARSTADLVQAQRDFFGRHSFKRRDKDGDHHGPWASDD